MNQHVSPHSTNAIEPTPHDPSAGVQDVDGQLPGKEAFQAGGHVISVIGAVFKRQIEDVIESLAGTLKFGNWGTREMYSPESTSKDEVAFVVNPGCATRALYPAAGLHVVLGSFLNPHEDIPVRLTKSAIQGFLTTLHSAGIPAVVSLPSSRTPEVLESGVDVFYIVSTPEHERQVKGALAAHFGDAVVAHDETKPKDDPILDLLI